MASPREYYRILGLDEDATPSDVRSAYRRAAHEHHPDHNPGDAAAAGRFKQVQEAYEVLSDPARRADYDRPPPPAPPAWSGGSYAAAWTRTEPPVGPRRAGIEPEVLPPELIEALLALRTLAYQAQLEQRFRRLIRYLESL